MYVLITYDVKTGDDAGKTRLRKVAKCCQDYGQRVQNSVFECSMSESLFVILRAKLNKLINHDTDSIRIYRLGNNYHNKIEHIGAQTSYDIESELII